LKVRELEDIFQKGQFKQYLSMQEKKQALGKMLHSSRNSFEAHLLEAGTEYP